MRWSWIPAGVLCLAWGTSLCAQAPANEFDQLLHQAFELHQRSDYAHSLPLLRSAWKLQPHDYFVNLLLGIDLLRSGSPSDAIRHLHEASRARPQEEFPYEYLGEANAALGRYASAAEAYAEGMRKAPQSSEAAVAYVDFTLARFAAISGELRSSRPGLAAEYRLQARTRPPGGERVALLERAAGLDEGATGIWGELALAQATAGQTDDAAESLAKSRRQQADDLGAWQAEAMLAAQKQDWASAARKLNAVAARSPAVFAQAVEEWPTGLVPSPQEKVPGAASAFLKCVAEHCDRSSLATKLAAAASKQQSSSAVLFKEQRWEQLAARAAPSESQLEAWLERGIALANIENCGKAIPALERGVSGKAAQVYGKFLLSRCYAEQAGAVADRVARSGENDAAVHMMRGDVLLRLQADSAGAIAEYQAALAKRGNDPGILQRLAEAQLGAGQMDAARASAEQALRLDPQRLPAMRTLAKVAMEARNYSLALQYLRPLAEREPSDLATKVELGTACAQTGALDEALKNLEPALKGGYPDEKGSLHSQLGAVLRKLGRTAEANAAFVEARELSDNFQRASRREETAGDHP